MLASPFGHSSCIEESFFKTRVIGTHSESMCSSGSKYNVNRGKSSFEIVVTVDGEVSQSVVSNQWSVARKGHWVAVHLFPNGHKVQEF